LGENPLGHGWHVNSFNRYSFGLHSLHVQQHVICCNIYNSDYYNLKIRPSKKGGKKKTRK